jgi:Domain of unknown function (DUF6048)
VAAAQPADTLQRNRFLPTGVRVGTDILALAKTSFDDTFDGWELNADVDFYRYYFAVDYGYWARDYVTDEGLYSNGGDYVRLGVDVNFLKKDPDKNMFFFGMRYGRSAFSEDLTVDKIDPVWGPISTTLTNSNVSAQWFELTTGLRVKIWRMIWLGYTARLKFGLSTGDTPDMLPHDVPGYGRAEEDSYWGFNYQIFVRLPVRKSTAIPVK